MKPPAFEYFAPASLDEALSLRAEHAEDSALLAGGQSLIPLLSLRIAYPAVIIDLGRIPELAGIRELDGGIAIGAMTRQRDAERSGLARERCPLLGQALAHVGHPTIRNRGTIGGSVAHAEPAAELPAVMLALDAQLVARSVRGDRVIPASAFFRGLLTTALEPDELLVEIRLPASPRGSKSAFVEFARRHGDFALAGAAAVVAIDGAGRVADARLAFISGDTRPVRALDAEQALLGARPGESVFREAAEAAAAALKPRSDVHAPAEYRRRVAAVTARRALVQAAGVSALTPSRPS